jgi:LysR family glycine cleavage system transcriptional activator
MTLPPLKSLYYFSVVAEKKSIKTAAAELFVTQAAVSQQIKMLEKTLGLPLFKREHRALSLTTEGKRLAPFLSKAFNTINEGVKSLREDNTPNVLTISVLPSFASRWLIPRLSRFYSQYPDLTINLSMTERLEDFADSNVDLAIRFGKENPKNLHYKPLMKEYIYPVYHKDYKTESTLETIADLKKERLIDDIDIFGCITWNHWLTANQADPSAFKNRQRYDGSHYVIDSVLSKQGIAIVRHSLAIEPIKQGNLTRLFTELNHSVIEIEQQYYICAPEHHYSQKKVAAFCQWLQLEAAAFSTDNALTSK